ncbi:hypothetical protein EDD15DRAFT_1872496 [Pisolithus albus]|nr:hypothetical protein EDD15DRAFT_1872496 [Pisolithus albus]
MRPVLILCSPCLATGWGPTVIHVEHSSNEKVPVTRRRLACHTYMSCQSRPRLFWSGPVLLPKGRPRTRTKSATAHKHVRVTSNPIAIQNDTKRGISARTLIILSASKSKEPTPSACRTCANTCTLIFGASLSKIVY